MSQAGEVVHWVLVLAVRAGGEERGRAVAVAREGRWEKRMAVMMWAESRWCIADSGVGYVGVGFGFVAVRDLNEMKVNPTLCGRHRLSATVSCPTNGRECLPDISVSSDCRLC